MGLSTLEAHLYLGLLERQKTTAGALAKHVGMKRSTVYTILENLIQKGLVSLTKVEHVKHYQAESVERLADWLGGERKKLEAREAILAEVHEDLSGLAEQRIAAPKVSIYEGKKGVESLLMQNLDQNPREVLVIGAYMKDQDLIPNYTKRRTLLAPDPYRFPASFHIYEDSISIFTFKGEDPVGVHIQNKDISETMKMVFELVKEGLSRKNSGFGNWAVG